MRIGQTVRIRVRVPAGSAYARRQVPNETCTFELDVHVDIKRVKPPSGR